MRKRFHLAVALLVFGSIASLSATTLLGPGQVVDPREQLQIMFVLDLSSSMRSPVITGETPDDLSTLVQRLIEIENSPEYLAMAAEMQAIEEGQGFSLIARKWESSVVARDTWLAEKGLGRGLDVILEALAGRLSSLECDPSLNNQMASAQTIDEMGTWIDIACVGISVAEDERQSILDSLAFVGDQEYQDLRAEVEAATQSYMIAIDDLGYGSIADELSELLTSSSYYQLAEDLQRSAETYGFPTRLTLSTEAIKIMVDLAVMDSAVNSRNLKTGLVTFSNIATVIHSLEEDPQQIKAKLSELEPIQHTNLSLGLQSALDEINQRGTPEQPSLVILLSDGNANMGSSSSVVLEQLLSADNGATPICSLAIAGSDERIEAGQLEKIAVEAGGEFLTTASLEQVPSFFMNCRRRAAPDVVEHSIGIVQSGDQTTAARITVPRNTCALKVTMRHLGGQPFLLFADPGGDAIDESYQGAVRQNMEGLQLLTILAPKAGTWTAMIKHEDLEPANMSYSLVTRGTPCMATPTPILPTPTPTPSLLVPKGYMEQAWPYIASLGLLGLAGLFALLVVRSERRLSPRDRDHQTD